MATTLGNHDPEKEVFIAYPASTLAKNTIFKNAHKMFFPSNIFFINNKYQCAYSCNAPHMQCVKRIAYHDICILTQENIQVVNHLGVEAFGNVKFYKLPKEYVYCLVSTDDYIVFDEDRFILHEIQKQYNIPNDIIHNIKKQIWYVNDQLTLVRSQYDIESDFETL